MFRVDSTRDLNENSLRSVTGVDTVHTVHGQIINTGGVYSVQGSLYPELEKLEIEAAEVFFMHFFINLFIYSFFHLFIYLFILLCIYLLIYSFIHSFILSS